jgi:hypothetical protein
MRVDPTEHPSHIGNAEALSLTERATFGHDAVRCPTTGRVFEQGSGALPHEQQTALFVRQAAIAEHKAAMEREAEQVQRAAPVLRMVGLQR